jgi:hypothetical protein
MIGHCSQLNKKLYLKKRKSSNLVSKHLRKISKITPKSRTRGKMISPIGNTNLINVKQPSKAMRINMPSGLHP